MARAAQQIHIPNLEPKFIRDCNPEGHWIVEGFNQSISLLNKTAASLPKRLPWRQRNVEQLYAEQERLNALGRPFDAYRLLWMDMLDQVQAFGLLSAWRLTELVQSAVWATRRDDPLCAAIIARAALETTASYAWFQTKIRPGIEAVIGSNDLIDMRSLEEEILKTLWASRLEDAEKIYNPTNIVTIIDHITNKIPHQEDVGVCYRLLCEVAHPNMLGRSLFLSKEGELTIISRERGPSVKLIRHASLLGLSWAAATLPRSLTPMQDTCIRMIKDLDRFEAFLNSG